jgi:glucose-1-phosphate cytidylyltransferase
MKVVILAGGMGTRFAEESDTRPKPMIEIGGRPILWHIMKIYAHYGLTDFIVCLGYRGYVIKEYFANFVMHNSDLVIDVAANRIEYRQNEVEPWKIALVDTGAETLTAGRLKRVRPYLDPGEPFCFTYGDGVAAIDISALIAFHRSHGHLATLTAVIPPGRYGAVDIEDQTVRRFIEKPPGDEGYISGGFFVVDPSVTEMIEGDRTSWEAHTLPDLALEGELKAYHHPGFWHAMDTLRDKRQLEELWSTGNAPWKVWR